MKTADGSDHFCATHWTLVLEAARPNSAGYEAFGKLYSDYWHPLYAFIRRRGFSPEEAEDITQGFFARTLEKEALGGLKREGGRFRSFLLAALSNFLANEWDRSHAQKRGGGVNPLALDTADEEGRYVAESATPESLFEKQWVLTLLNHVLERLRSEQGERSAMFEDLRPHLQRDSAGLPYAEIARKHGTSEGAVKVTVHRLRHRYGDLPLDFLPTIQQHLFFLLSFRLLPIWACCSEPILARLFIAHA